MPDLGLAPGAAALPAAIPSVAGEASALIVDGAMTSGIIASADVVKIDAGKIDASQSASSEDGSTRWPPNAVAGGVGADGLT